MLMLKEHKATTRCTNINANFTVQETQTQHGLPPTVINLAHQLISLENTGY